MESKFKSRADAGRLLAVELFERDILCICLLKPESFITASLWYEDFPLTTDPEVCELLGRFMQQQPAETPGRRSAKLIVTARDPRFTRRTKSALRKTIPKVVIHNSGFRHVFLLEAEADVFELAKRIYQNCREHIGHAMPVLAEVESSFEPIRECAVKIGTEHIGSMESFCFRITKRGAHHFERDTPEIEAEIGGAIWTAIEQKYGKKPAVDLDDPDVTILAEVLGPVTLIGILRKEWQQRKIDDSD